MYFIHSKKLNAIWSGVKNMRSVKIVIITILVIKSPFTLFSSDLYSGDNIIGSPFTSNSEYRFPRVITVNTEEVKLKINAMIMIALSTNTIQREALPSPLYIFVSWFDISTPIDALYITFTIKKHISPKNSSSGLYIKLKHITNNANKCMYCINGKHDAICIQLICTYL